MKPFFLLLLLAFFLFSNSGNAQKVWDGGGGSNNWADGNNWNPNGVPNNTDAVTIGNGFNVILNTNATVASLTIGGGTSGTLTLGNNNSNRTLTVSGVVTINNGATLQTAGNGGNVLNIGNNLVNNSTFDMRLGGATADVTFNGTANQTISGAGTTTDFNLITINNTGAANNNILEVLPANFTTAAGFLTLTRGMIKMSGSYTFTNTFFNTANPVINADEGIWLNNANVTVTGQNGDTQLSGLLRITAGTYNIGVAADYWLIYFTGAIVTIEGGALNISGAFIPNSSTETITYTQSNGIVTICTAGNNFSLSSFDLTATGSSFTMSNGSIIFQNPSISLPDYSNNAVSNSVTGGSIQFGNASTPSSPLFLMSGTAPVYDVIVNASNTPTLQFSTAISVLRDVINNSTIDADAFDQTLTIGRNWTNNGTFAQGTGTVIFNSTTQAQTIGGTNNTTFYNLTNTNTNALGLSLSRAVTVSNILSLSSASNGKLSLGANNLTIATGGSITGANATRYIVSTPTTGTNGRLRQNNLTTAARVFPIGTATNYLPVTITPASTGSDFSLNVFRSTTTNGLPTGGGFSPRSMQADAVYWIDRAAGSSNAQIRFDWQTNAIEGSVFTTLPTSPNKIGIWRLISGTWVLANGATSTNYIADNTSNFVYTNGTLSAFGTAGTGYPYIVANIDILPLHITNLKATKINNGALLNWDLTSIDKITHFEIQKSREGRNFTTIAIVNATDKTTYSFTDVDLYEGSNYYRIKVFETQGEISYSYIVAVGNKLKATVEFYSNPVQQQLLFKHPAAVNAMYKIIDLSGRQVKVGRIPVNAVITQIDLSNLASGQYVLQYVNNAQMISKQFIKE